MQVPRQRAGAANHHDHVKASRGCGVTGYMAWVYHPLRRTSVLAWGISSLVHRGPEYGWFARTATAGPVATHLVPAGRGSMAFAAPDTR